MVIFSEIDEGSGLSMAIDSFVLVDANPPDGWRAGLE